MTKKTIDWHKVDAAIEGLATDEKHEISVQREAIPIIFVPGVMGSRLRRAGTDGKEKNRSKENLPNLRWDPTAGFLYRNYSGKSPAHRKAMLIGGAFDPNYLEVDNVIPVGDGLAGIMEDYRPFLHTLKTHDWGALSKLFVFPVYAFGYNWTDDSASSGKKLAARIDEIIKEAKSIIGLCEKVILITHSMGGLVARAASKLGGAEGNILGVINGVQPAFGAASAYWRIKAGFDGDGFSGKLASRFLGPTGRDTTVLLGNSIGGLQLLPNKNYRTNGGGVSWLWITGANEKGIYLPSGDPYASIYRVKAIVNPSAGKGASNNAYWGLIDPDLLTPEITPPLIVVGSGEHISVVPDYNDLNYKIRKMKDTDSAWNKYVINLKAAEIFHDNLGKYIHLKTWRFHGSGLDTAEYVKLNIESSWVQMENYPTRGFRGFFRNASNSSMKTVLQDSEGDGDGTVPVSSATFLGTGHKSPDDPPNHQFDKLKHQPAFEDIEVQRWVICVVTALCKQRFNEKHGK